MRVKLTKLDEWNAWHAIVAEEYLKYLAKTDNLILPFVPDYAKPVWHIYVVRHSKRDQLQEYLKKAGVGTLIHYPIPPHLSEAY